tara:strand:+ start:139 stop:408 length:270 start_codon:yes stop_codon:yes gene_type:complete
MKVGDLIREISSGRIGFVEKVDQNYYGARTAFKFDPDLHGRGECVNTRIPDFIGKTKKGINDRVMVQWTDKNELQYFFGNELEVINESK